MNQSFVDLRSGFEYALASVIAFLPKFAVFLVILIGGYFLARFVGTLLDRFLERVKFDQLVERGGIKRALARCEWDASDLLGKLLFYTVFLFVLQLAFGVFGPNPVSGVLTRIIAFLPHLIVAVLMVIIAAGVASGVKRILLASLGGLSYGRYLANIAAITILVVGIFAALNQIGIAPAIVNGLFYAVLAIVVGSAVVAIGGGGIQPMRAQWEKCIRRFEAEAPVVKSQLHRSAEQYAEEARAWHPQMQETTP